MDGSGNDTNNKRIAKQLSRTMTHTNLDAEVLESGEIFRHVAVTVHETKVVLPAEPTEEGHFYLSNIDQMLIEPVETFFAYLPNRDRSSEEVFSVLEIALGKLLVPYHFMAGRFEVEPEDLGGRLQVNCNRAGAAFVIATSPQTIAELGDLKVMNPEFRKLVPSPLSSPSPSPSPSLSGVHTHLEDDFLLMVQVTRFRCGGFTVAFRKSHAMCDGKSSTLFFRTFCHLARSILNNDEQQQQQQQHQQQNELPLPIPDLDRTILRPRHPPTPEFAHPECFKLADAVPRAVLDITPDYLTKHIALSAEEILLLKERALRDGQVERCSSLEVTVAHFWQARTRSLDFGRDELSTILLAVDFRGRMRPPISENFCGNTIVSAHVCAPAAEVAESPLSFCVAKIQEAVARIDERYVRSALDWLQVHGGVPALGSPKDVLVSAWWKIPFYEHDFGWGKPVHAGPPSPGTTEYALIVANGTDDGGLFLLVSFRQHEMAKFEHHVRDIW